MVGVKGRFSSDRQKFSGRILSSGCGQITLSRNRGDLPDKARRTEAKKKPRKVAPGSAPQTGSTAHLSDKQRAALVDISGNWVGLTFCTVNKEAEPIRMTIRALGNARYDAETTIDYRYRELSSRDRIQPPKNRRALDPYYFIDPETGKPGRGRVRLSSIDEIFSLRGEPLYMHLAIYGTCDQAVLMKFKPIDGLGGAYKTWNSLPGRCKGFATWHDDARKARDRVRALLNKNRAFVETSPQLPRLTDILFDDAHFRKSFGTTIDAMGPRRFEALVRQISECVVYLADDDAGLKARLEGQLFQRRRMRDYKAVHYAKGALRFFDRGTPLVTSFTQLSARQKARRASAVKIRSLVAGLDGLKTSKALMSTVRQDGDLFGDLNSDALQEAVTAVRSRLTLLKGVASSAEDAEETQDRSPPPAVVTSDAMDGYGMIWPQFGHFTYVRLADLTVAGCRRTISMRVRLRSSLYLAHLTKAAYQKRFWDDTLRAIHRHCFDLGARRIPIKVNVEFLMNEKPVAAVTIRQSRMNAAINFDVRNAAGFVPHPATSPLHVFDGVAANFLRTDIGPGGESLPKTDIRDIEKLAQQGDVDALAALIRFPAGLRAKVDGKVARNLWYGDPSWGAGDLDEAAAVKAVEAGSTLAAYMYANSLMRRHSFMAANHQKGWSGVPASVKSAFIDAYGRAVAGGFYWTWYVGQAVDHYGIPVETTIADIRRTGLAGPIRRRITATPSKDLTGASALAAVRSYIVRHCSNFHRIWDLSEARAGGYAIIGAALADFRTRGSACIASLTVGWTTTFTHRVERISELQCKPDGAGRNCSVKVHLSCDWDSTDTTRDGQAANKLILNGLCRAAEFPTPVRGRFTRRQDGKWQIVGKLRVAP